MIEIRIIGPRAEVDEAAHVIREVLHVTVFDPSGGCYVVAGGYACVHLAVEERVLPHPDESWWSTSVPAAVVQGGWQVQSAIGEWTLVAEDPAVHEGGTVAITHLDLDGDDELGADVLGTTTHRPGEILQVRIPRGDVR